SAATEPLLHTSPTAHAAATTTPSGRDAGHVRSDESNRNQPVAGPAARVLDMTDSAFEAAATLPTPPPRPQYPATASMVDLVLPPPRPAAPAARFAPPAATAAPRVVPSSDRPLPQSPMGKSALSDTPRPAKGERPRPPSFPHLELPKSPVDLGHL